MIAPNAEYCEMAVCTLMATARDCRSLSKSNNYPYIYRRVQPESILLISKHKPSNQPYIRRSCSAAAKWKRKFSVTGGKWCRFKLSSVILESSHSSARATKLSRISFVLTEISCESQSCCQTQGCRSYMLMQVHLGCLTLTTWLSDLSGSSAACMIRCPMSLCNLPMAIDSIMGHGART